jgi:hypothetical protein
MVDINDLEDINPFTIGFLQNVLPRYETLSMHTNRIAKLFPVDAPKFQLQFRTLWGQTGERTRTLLIKCDEINRELLINYFEELHQKKMLHFFSWSDYTSCTPDQKTTIVKKINQWRGNFRSFILPGFKKNDDNVPMVYNSNEDFDPRLKQMGVTEYLQNEIKNSNGERLFYYVYPPQDGVRELIAPLKKFSEALSFLKVALGEMARNMDQQAIELVFNNAEQVKMD